MVAGVCEAVLWQKLACSYEIRHEDLQRVWCRQSSPDCCIGLIFNRSDSLLDEGKLMVTEGSQSFTVTVLKPGLEEGVYWCGVLTQDGVIIKLAERFFDSGATGTYVWNIARWVLLPLLPMVTVFTNVYIRKIYG
ncbi:uncharacterized protein si:ch211-102c2.4 isoform X2 [Antennarius striatus]|uniref:uncharacterized protein si:ch211-102c2.4 isoform X2 n=1 Tax=Antennarius striatus TaxID=241820 RepID=UPI0035B1E3B1